MVKKAVSKNVSLKSKITSKDVVKKPKTKKSKRSISGQKLTEKSICQAIHEKCLDDDALLVLNYSKGVAVILKKTKVTVSNTTNPDSMQPYQEKPHDRTFFNVFILQWIGVPLKGQIVDIGVPVTWVSTPYEALLAIKKA